MKKVFTVLLVLVVVGLFGVLSVSAANGNSQAGGLPALSKRVTILEAKVALLITTVGNMQADITALKDAVKALKKKVWDLYTDVKDLKGQNNWAVVNSSGDVVRHSPTKGDVVATKLSTGTYDVAFTKKDVTGCAYVATIGDPGKASAIPGMITVSSGPVSGVVNDVQVQTFDKDGTLTDNAFHLYVSCP